MRKYASIFMVIVCLAAGVAGCDSAGQLTGSEAPQFSANRGLTKLAATTDASGTITKVIGGSGGTLQLTNSLGTHDLRVPVATVTQPVVFSMSFRGSGYDVALSAWEERNPSNDVGTRGFRRIVLLCLDVSGAAVAPERLVIAEELANGTLQPVPSTIDTRTGQLCGALRHFSNYTVATD